MKRIYALLAVLVMTGSTGSAQQNIRLMVKKTKTNFIDGNTVDFGNNEAWKKFWSFKQTTFLGAYFSEPVEIADGEAVRPIQTQYFSFGNLPETDWPRVPNHVGPELGLKVALQFKIPEHDKWLTITHSKQDDTWTGVNSKKPVIHGPAMVRLAFEPGTIVRSANWDTAHGTKEHFHNDSVKLVMGGVAWCTLEKTKNWGNLDEDNNIIVMPNTSSDMSLLVESSDDLVNWTRDQPGDKPAGNRKRFYRLRAVKK